MKKIYLSLLVFFISASVFAAGWFQDFSSGRPSIYTSENENTAPDDEWYITGISGLFSNSGWKVQWSYDQGLKPAGSFIFLDGVSSVGDLTEFSLVSPAFTPTDATDLYYRIQEIKVSDYPDAGAEELYLEIARKIDNIWTWTNTTNVLADLVGHNVSTTAATVLHANLSDYADQPIKIRFRGTIATGNFVAVIYSVALVNNTVTDLAVSASPNIISQIPKHHAGQALNASNVSVQNQGGQAVATGAATVTASVAGSDIATASVSALQPLELSSTLTFTPAFAPQSFGEYQFQYALTNDDNNANNTATSNTFVVTPNTFASDAGTVESTTSNQYGDIGKKFTLTESERIESISLGWGKLSTDPVSSDFQWVIYQLNADGSLASTTPVHTSSGTLTRPNNATTPPNDRVATFETYPVGQNLEAGSYIFGVKKSANVGLGSSVDDHSVYYSIDEGVLTPNYGQNLLIRVNTASDITLSPPVATRAVGINDTIFIGGSAVTGLAASPEIAIVKKDGSAQVAGIFASYAANKVTVAHNTFEYNTEYTVTIPANTLTGYPAALSWSFTTVAPLEAKIFSPANNAENIVPDAPITVTFDRDIPAGSSFSGITIATDEATPVSVADVSATFEGSVLTIAHAPFAIGKKYKVTIPATANNELTEAVSWVFTTVQPFGLASTNPYFPADGDTEIDLPLNNIRVIFNQPVNTASTLNGITINGVPVPVASTTIGIGNQNNRVTINTSNIIFEPNTIYTVVIPAGAISGYDEVITWSFSKLEIAVVGTLPNDSAKDVSLDTEISVEFNKSVFKNGFPPIPTITAEGAPIAGVSYEVDTVNNHKVIISHTEALAPETEYTVTLPAEAVGAWGEDIVWKFTTGAGASELQIVGFTPVDSAENVAVLHTVEITFNNPITLGNTDAIRINDDAPTSVTVQNDTRLRLNHAAFAPNTEYTVTIPAGSVVGYDSDTSWTFTTVPALVYTTSPANDAIDVALDAPLQIGFNREPLRPRLGSPNITVTGDNGETITVSGNTWNASGDTLTIAHAPFDPGVNYTVTVVATSIVDLNDWSSEQSDIVWSFTTASQGAGIQTVKDVNGVYPTFSHGEITVISNPGSRIKIVDITGAVQATYRSADKQSVIRLDAAPGVYFVVIETGKSAAAYKIVLQK
ncbi:MAG: Ig-like domain-containing protein [Dysgonamonadaceae bacterium]|jgi:hypothetical protein|nr:Ig-like domain-containing protein [Dysgonamonadaceae bacterium]